MPVFRNLSPPARVVESGSRPAPLSRPAGRRRGAGRDAKFPLTIFHILTHAWRGAGNVCAAVDIACEQARRGHTVYVCHSRGHFDDLLAQHGVKVVHVDHSGGIAMVLPALVRLYGTLRAVKPDIVHAHMIMSTLLAATLRPLLGYKLVTTVHNEFQRSAILMMLGQRVIGVSEAVSASMRRRGVPASRMRTVLNGTINSPRRPPPTPPPMVLPRPSIVSVCGMHPRKGVTDLLAAYALVAADLPDAQLHLIGTGPMLEEYKARALAMCPAGITFHGHMDDPRPALLGCDIFVLASHAEPAPLVMSEAREAGCAIVATQVGGIPEMVEHGAAAILVPPRRPDLLAQAILRLLKDPQHLAEMRARTQQNIERFTMARLAVEVENIYREIVR
jgi:glycosyltransferase involved in cell wall biosynthesis